MLFTVMIGTIGIAMFIMVMKEHLVRKECGIMPIYSFIEILIGAFCIWYGMNYQPYKADYNVLDVILIIPLIAKAGAEEADKGTGQFIIRCGIFMIILGIIIIITAIVLGMLPHFKTHRIPKQRRMENQICTRTTEEKLNALDQEYAQGMLTEQEYALQRSVILRHS